MKTVRLTTAQAIVRFLIAQRTVDRRQRGAALPGRVRDLRPRQRDRPRLRAGRGARRAADDPRPERAGHGAGGDRLREGDAAPADHGGDVVRSAPARRTWSRPPAWRMANRLPLLLLVRRHLPEPHPRSGAAAGRALRLALDHRQRRLPRRSRATGTASRTRRRWPSRCRSPSRRCSTRPTAARPSSACRRTSRPRRTTTPSGCSSRASTSCAGSVRTHASWTPPPPPCAARTAPADRRRRRRPLLARRGRGCAASSEQHGLPVVETVAGKSLADRRPPVLRRADRRHRLRRRPTGWRPRPIVVLAVGTRLQDFTTGSWTVFGERGRCASSASTPRASTRPSTARCRSWATRARGSTSSARRSAAGGAEPAWTARAREERGGFRDVRRRERGRARRRRRRPYAQVDRRRQPARAAPDDYRR